MTNCNTQPLLFSNLKNKKIQADFNGGSLTSDAGAALLQEVDNRIGLINAINRCIPDPRHPFFIVHDQKTMLAQRIFGIALGYEDLNDHQSLRQDPLFQIISERDIKDDMPPASPPTLCRLENRIDRKTLAEIAKVFVERFIASYTQSPDELILTLPMIQYMAIRKSDFSAVIMTIIVSCRCMYSAAINCLRHIFVLPTLMALNTPERY